MSAGAPPADAAALLRQAWSALQRGQPAQARRDCESALRQVPRSFDGWRLLAVATRALGDHAACRGALSRAHALRPDDGGTALDLGSLLLGNGEAGAALPLLRTAKTALPDDPSAAFRYATAAFVVGDFDAAADGFAEAARRKPQWPEAWNNLAAAHGKRQDYPAAIAAARNALRLAPGSAPAHHALAALQSNLFDRDALSEGLRAAERALQLDPQQAETHRIAAILARKLGQADRAEQHARRALQLAPADPGTIDTLGEQLLLNHKPGDAVAVYRAAADRGIATPALRRQHGIALLHHGQPGPARDRLLDLLDRHPDDQRAIAHLGVAESAAGAPQAAAERLGLHRHVHAIDLPTPAGFDRADRFHAALADDIRRHSRQRWQPAGLAARQAWLSGDLLADRTPAILGFEQALRAAIDTFIGECRARRAAGGADRDLFLRNVPPDSYRLHVWSTVAAQSGYIDTHIHEESWLSGAYYVQLPPALGGGNGDDDSDGGSGDCAGWIEFGRPFAGLPAGPAHAVRRVRPQVGTLLLFPSYLFHRTLPYSGEGERISISFDLAAEPT